MEKSSDICVQKVMSALSDAKCIYIITQIASAEVDSETLLSESELSKKAFYFRISRFLKAGIVTRKNRKLSLTSFGKIVFHAQDLITTAFKNYWKLSALDSLASVGGLPISEYNKICEKLLADQKIRNAASKNIEQTQNNKPLILTDAISMRTSMSRSSKGAFESI